MSILYLYSLKSCGNPCVKSLFRHGMVLERGFRLMVYRGTDQGSSARLFADWAD